MRRMTHHSPAPTRRGLLLGALALAALPGQALAQTAEDRIVRQLQAQGYRDIRVRRTLLGRVRILARRGSQEREIVLSPATGEILRDYWEDEDDGRVLRSDDRSGSGRSGSGRDDKDDDRDDGKDDDRDDGKDDDKDDDRDDDNSGRGGGGDDDDDDDDDRD